MTSPLWRQIQRQNFRDWRKLFEFLKIDEELELKLLKEPRFTLNLPQRLALKIKKNTLDDPLFRQFVALKDETITNPAFKDDPVDDKLFKRKGRLLHKYQGRALLVTSGACAMHCRYCFRQNFDYGGDVYSFDEELEIIKNDNSLTEIILSGGDPLSLSNESLKKLIDEIESIKHVKRIRFHTRFPIGIPERIDEGFLDIIAKTSLQVWFVIHCNHPNELDEDIFLFLKKLQKLGVPILNQSVLLKGVNDDFKTQKTLLEMLVNQGILPYYLHQLDLVQGASHFEADQEECKKMIESLRSALPGFAVPKYVKEIAFAANKTLIN
jgi:EF-P beta-lysylation protein EpmB